MTMSLNQIKMFFFYIVKGVYVYIACSIIIYAQLVTSV